VNQPSESARCARTLVGQLLAQGVTDFVLAPGSRSAPFALCLEASARAGLLRLHVRVDERAAGFLALGLAKGSGRCVAVVTTSGTAVGNLVPAVMEAWHSAVPLLVISADRPSWMVGFGSNQTTEQGGLFAGFLTYSTRVAAGAPAQSWSAQAARAVLLAEGRTGGSRGPAHLNIELPEPLVDSVSDWIALPGATVASGPLSRPVAVPLPGTPRTLVLCGDAEPDVGRAAVRLAETAGLPLVAEPSSNARSAVSVSTGRLLLAGELGGQVERVVVFGRPTLSRPVSNLLARSGVEVVVVTDRPDFVDPGWRAQLVAAAVSVEPGPTEWLAAWRRADGERAAKVADAIHAQGRHTGPALAAAVVASVAPGDIMCLGNSNAIRDADLVPPGVEQARTFANRGLSGIDGTVATAIGISLGTARPTTLLCGDLSFIHDVGALAIGASESRPTLRIVVADDDGGSIFATLEYGSAPFAARF
jgi:2-succinyl-5-enolpyruvyl-6-hydroxy-3-cyclohexene-1-carboxylate synthase